MNITDFLHIFATVALGLAAVSGILLGLGTNRNGGMDLLHRARITVLFQLSSVALVLGILPLVLSSAAFTQSQVLRISSAIMAFLIAICSLMTRRIYSVTRTVHRDVVTAGKQFLFHGSLAGQLLLTASVGAGFLQAAGPLIYLVGLAILLALAFHQLVRFVGPENVW